MLLAVGVDYVPARVKEKQRAAQAAALAEDIHRVVAVAEKLIGAELAQAVLIVGEILEQQVFIEATLLSDLVVAEYRRPIYTELLHHLSKLNSVCLLCVGQYDIAREHYQIGLDILDVAHKALNGFFVILHAVVKVQIGAREDDKILVAHVAVRVKFCDSGGIFIRRHHSHPRADMLGVRLLAEEGFRPLAAAQFVDDLCKEKIDAYQALPDECP